MEESNGKESGKLKGSWGLCRGYKHNSIIVLGSLYTYGIGYIR